MNIFQKLGIISGNKSGNTVKKGKDIAKKRLQLVLVQDRLNISAKDISAMKDDLIRVIGNYMAIDIDAMDVSLHRDGDSVALVANIPVLTSSRR